ncbi:hypothetical protein D3C81_2170640 [compost metagenome]
MPKNASGIFHRACASDTRLLWLAPGGNDNAPMTWGMPLPDALGAKRRVSQRKPARLNGSTSKASQPLWPTHSRFQSSALSAR